MLKIKDDISLKELEKFGFVEIEYNEDTRPYYKYESKKATMGIGRTKRDIWCNGYLETMDEENFIDTLYDLIQAGLVEKVRK